MTRLHKWYNWWKRLPPILFVLFTALLAFLLSLPISYGFELAGISDEEIGGYDIETYGLLGQVASVLILAPILETLISQSLPFYLVRRYVRWKPRMVAVLVSTTIFSLCHAGYSYWYALAVMPGGLLLAWTFMVFQYRRGSAFWMTAAVHSVVNFITLLLYKLTAGG